MRYQELEGLFNEQFRALCLFAVSFVNDGDVAEDLVQEAFISLWERRNKLKGKEKEAISYLYSAVRNKCLNHIRHQKVRSSSAERIILATETWEEDHLHRLIRAEVYNTLYKAIEQLPPQCRKIYKLAYFSKMPENKIAETLSISVNSIKSQKQRGKALLKKYLKGLYSILFM